MWTTKKNESRMEVEDLDTSVSDMSVAEWCDAHQSESVSDSSDSSGGEGGASRKSEHTKQEAMAIDADVVRWLEANQTPVKEGRQCGGGSGDGSGSGSGSGCGSGNSGQHCSAALAVLDYGVLRLIMKFLPMKRWCTILPAVCAGARHATVEGRKPVCVKGKTYMQRYMAQYRAAQLNC